MKFRKKPVEIEAIRWDGKNQDEIYEFAKDTAGVCMITQILPQIEDWSQVGPDKSLTIETLEGAMTARQGDWIIKGIKGEFYPCKPDIFEETYEAI